MAMRTSSGMRKYDLKLMSHQRISVENSELKSPGNSQLGAPQIVRFTCRNLTRIP